MTSIEAYREQVREAILLRNGSPVLNGSADHAAVVIQEMLGNAQHKIRLLTTKLDTDCYARQGVRDAAKAFFAGAARSACILIEGSLWDGDEPYDWATHPLIEDLSEFGKGDNPRLQLRRVPHNWAVAYKYNFMIMDDYGYRFEADRSRPAAVAAFLPAEDAARGGIENLSRIFDAIWNHSDKIDLGQAA